MTHRLWGVPALPHLSRGCEANELLAWEPRVSVPPSVGLVAPRDPAGARGLTAHSAGLREKLRGPPPTPGAGSLLGGRWGAPGPRAHALRAADGTQFQGGAPGPGNGGPSEPVWLAPGERGSREGRWLGWEAWRPQESWDLMPRRVPRGLRVSWGC